jgi:hypothetical protein
MKYLVLLLCLLPQVLCSQINIHKAGDGWDSIVKQAILLINKTSPTHYKMLVEHVDVIEFWNEDYSSNNIVDGKGVIVVSSKDIKLNSLNNIAAVLVHETYHLHLMAMPYILSGHEEEYQAYSFELKFLKLLQNVEPDLLAYTKEQVKLWNTK